jgi:hypothetical protein
MQSDFVDSIAEGRCRPTAARNEDSQFGSWFVLGLYLSIRTMPILMAWLLNQTSVRYGVRP